MKKTLVIIGIFMVLSLGCEPKKGTIEDKEAVKQDTVDPREGEGEGDVGEGVYGR
ncbi:hypothetical protein LVD17_27670 [Fulvivirga ulvae]|uniref:hypothetical protein n=1 Tax=Fulvivirga ulvae TaxID=2904245 RepID=UPI001F204345|nr:hypothetical protein [Fulvivirga ulvae]UII32066.1 hypothetical protein LVD17_27670 [Fulvivirga ulvae]